MDDKSAAACRATQIDGFPPGKTSDFKLEPNADDFKLMGKVMDIL